jgi:hypothetical protein
MNEEIKPVACPACVIKHLSAALTLIYDHRYLLKDNSSGAEVTEYAALVCRAAILAQEASHGYPLHRFLAEGLLSRAEAMCDTEPTPPVDVARMIRDYRLSYGKRGDWTTLDELCRKLFDWRAVVVANLHEAFREMPDGDTNRQGLCVVAMKAHTLFTPHDAEYCRRLILGLLQDVESTYELTPEAFKEKA